MSGVPETDPQKTFYLETFGCQMNVHDSEKVVGTLLQEGYRQVQTVDQADLILYNTCSIRDKAEQKVFHRLADFKKLQAEGKKFGVLGCVAQQEGEKIFERAPHVSMVCGSASYRNLSAMLVQVEAGKQRVTGLDDRQTDECFETEFTARTNPHRGYITIIEGCDKFCAYCVVPFTRGKERSRGSQSVLAEARQMADLGYSEIQLLGQNEDDFAQTLSLLEEVGFDAVFAFKYSPRPNTPSLSMEDAISDEEKSRRLEVLMARQRDIQTISYRRYVGLTSEVMVEGYNETRGQWIGRTSHNKTVNFTSGANQQ